jgi:hypothetical protein
MRLNKFEKYISEKIDEYPSQLDTESLWDTLESDLDKKKKRRRFIIFWMLFLIAVIGFLIFCKFQTDQNQSNTPATEISTINNLKSSVDENTSSVRNQNQNENENENQNGNENQSATHIIEFRNSELLKKQELSQVFQGNNEVNRNASGQAESSINNVVSLESMINSVEINPNTIAKNENTRMMRSNDLEKIAFLDLAPFNFLNRDKDLSTQKNVPKIKSVKNWSLFIAPNFGVYHTDRKITQKNASGAVLKDLRIGSERTLETISLGIGLELKNRNNFFFSGGINFNQITEQFNDQRSEFTSEEIEIVTEINYLSTGERQEVMGTFDQSHEIISTKKVYNTLRWTEFNVGGGYYFTNKRWTIGASGGLLWGMMLNAEGKMLDTENDIIEIENSGIYKSNLGLGAFANLEVGYALQPRLKLSAQLGYKRMSSSFTTEDYPLEIAYQWFGAAIGLRYKIN